MRRGEGRIVNMSSTAGKNVCTVDGRHFVAAKAGMLSLVRHLASEEAPNGMTVNATGSASLVNRAATTIVAACWGSRLCTCAGTSRVTSARTQTATAATRSAHP